MVEDPRVVDEFMRILSAEVAREVELRQYSGTESKNGLAERSKWNGE